MGGWHLDLNSLVKGVWSTFAEVAAPQSQFYWPYLLSATGLAFILYCVRHGSDGNLRLTAFAEFCFSKQVYAHPSAQLDFRFFVVNAVLYGMFIAPMMLTSAEVGNGIVDGLVHICHPPVCRAVCKECPAIEAPLCRFPNIGGRLASPAHPQERKSIQLTHQRSG